MKLHLPSFLRCALLACMACATTTYAATYLAEGVTLSNPFGTDYEAYVPDSDRFYDGGKGRDWDIFEGEAYRIYNENNQDLSVFGELASGMAVPSYQSRLDCSALYNDSGHCWAYTSANMLQYWQTYYGVFSKKVGETKAAPVHGYTYDEAYIDRLGGTQSLKLNKLFYDSFDGEAGGSTNKAFGWYLQGENQWTGQLDYYNGAPGYFRQYYGHYNDTHKTINGQNLSSLGAMSDSIKTAFGYTQQNQEWMQTTKGQIVHLELKSGSNSHAITCYGFETGADGNITALYVVNSDDADFRLVKVYTKFEEYGYRDYRLSLHYDEECSGYQTYNAWAVTGWSNLATPEVLRTMLAEYESGKQVWMGTLDSWTDTSGKADLNVLPDDSSGWMKYAGTGTEYAGYYNTYYSAGSGVEFNDSASSGDVTVGEDIMVPSMAVNNSSRAYTFTGEDVTITTDSFTKTGNGAVTFDGVELVAGTVSLTNDVTFDKLHVTGTLSSENNRILANSVTLDGNATIGAIGSDAGENSIGNTSALTITGGTTTIRHSGWTGLKSLSLSDQAKLYVDASLNIGGDITTSETSTGSLGDGVTAGLETKWCTKVGGNVTLTGDLKAGAYIRIGGDANVTGNLIASGEGGDRSISIDGTANVSGNITTDHAITLSKGGTVKGKVSGSSLTVGGDATIGAIGSDAGENSIGNTAALTITGGTTNIQHSGWTGLKSLSLSDQAKLYVGASLNIGGDITTSETSTGSLGNGATAGLETKWCTKVGGNVTLTGDLKAGAYVQIGGDANVTGNVIASGEGGNRSISISGRTNVSGDIRTDHAITLSKGGSVGGSVSGSSLSVGEDVTVGGNVSTSNDVTFSGKADVTGNLSSTSGSVTAQGDLSVGGKATVTGSMSSANGSITLLQGGEVKGGVSAKNGTISVGGDLSNTSLTANSIAIGSEEGVTITMQDVSMTLQSNNLSLTNVKVTGNCSFTGPEGEMLTLNAHVVTFVLDDTNSTSPTLGSRLLALTGSTPLTLTTVAPNTFYINSDMQENVNVSGSMTLDLSYWAQEIEDGDYDSITLSFAESMDFAEGTTVEATFDGTTFVQATASSDNTATFGLVSTPGGSQPGENIPEPATTTLSLLALAALAARRRRDAQR